MNIYCSGIGGIGLSAYAGLQKSRGYSVNGSDRSSSVVTEDLAKQGIKVWFNQDGSQVPVDTDLFVYSEAIPADSPERKKADQLGIKAVSYPEAVAEISKTSNLIAVAGTHGKSSTTAMAAGVLLQTSLDPTIIVGTRLKELNATNWRDGKSDLFLLEACEYRRVFLNYSPNIILLTSADGDHLDYYKDKDDYLSAYREFVELLPSDGVVITHLNDPDCQEVVKNSKAKIINADEFELPQLSVPGEHMQQNAQLVLGLAKALGIEEPDVLAALKDYQGCWRRFELKGEYKGVPVIDDYAHHPRELEATLKAAAQAYPDKRIVCVFQPHTHHRTQDFYKEFTQAFTLADIVIIPNIYDARSDIEEGEIDVDIFVKDISESSKVEVLNGQSLEATEELLKKEVLKQGDVLLCLGAGDITNLTSKLVK